MNEQPKKKVSWNSVKYIGETFSKEDYDRTVDTETITMNIQNRLRKRLFRIPSPPIENTLDESEYQYPWFLPKKIFQPEKYVTIKGAKSFLNNDKPQELGIELTWKNVIDDDDTFISLRRTHSFFMKDD